MSRLQIFGRYALYYFITAFVSIGAVAVFRYPTDQPSDIAVVGGVVAVIVGIALFLGLVGGLLVAIVSGGGRQQENGNSGDRTSGLLGTRHEFAQSSPGAPPQSFGSTSLSDSENNKYVNMGT